MVRSQSITLFGEEQAMTTYETHLEEVRQRYPDLDPEAQARLAELEERKAQRGANGRGSTQPKTRPCPAPAPDDEDERKPRSRSLYGRGGLAKALAETRAMAEATRAEFQRADDRRVRIAAAEARVRQLEAETCARAEEARQATEAGSKVSPSNMVQFGLTKLTGVSADPRWRKAIVTALYRQFGEGYIHKDDCFALLRREFGWGDAVPGNAIGRVLYALDEQDRYGFIARYTDGDYALTPKAIALAKEE